MSQIVRVTTPSRLHFGLLRFAQDKGPSFGGLGMMIEKPRYVLELNISQKLVTKGLQADRSKVFAKKVFENLEKTISHSATINVIDAPPPHSGLGTGTQLALAVATGIQELTESPINDIVKLSNALGRGARSAIGTYGFRSGGLILETGHLPNESLGRLASRIDFPSDWRILLIRPKGLKGKSGQEESAAFSRLPSIPEPVTQELIQLANQEIMPAAEKRNFLSFTESLFQYGQLAGNCFAKVQGGPYATQQIHDLINSLREMDIAGVGQSSWGPTIFAMCDSNNHAEDLTIQLKQQSHFSECDLQIVCPNNTGAAIQKSAEYVSQ